MGLSYPFPSVPAVAREPEKSDCGSKTGWKKRDYSTLGIYAV
jgi:hypothetical protein